MLQLDLSESGGQVKQGTPPFWKRIQEEGSSFLYEGCQVKDPPVCPAGDEGSGRIRKGLLLLQLTVYMELGD